MGRITGLLIILILAFSVACEEVIEVDLNYAQPQLVIEAIIAEDSTCMVSLAKTSGYFTQAEADIVEDAQITLSDGIESEELDYAGDGIYRGNNIIGSTDRQYDITISYNSEVYEGSSAMPSPTRISQLSYGISEEQSHLNPYGDRVVTVRCTFNDDIAGDNYYLIRFSDEEGKLIERYYLLTESESNSGGIEYIDGNIKFSESLFYEGDFIEVKVYSVDEAVYNYFLQLTDILFWKRRIMPPTPYNPESNISNGALGYFAAWSFDSEVIIIE